MENKTTLIGAGLVGSLLATFLARRGFHVEVLERRPDMRKAELDGGRSINLAVSTRGLHALREVGLEEDVLKIAVPMVGRMVHPLSGEMNLQRYGLNEKEYINSVSRAELNKLLMTAAERTGLVQIQFDQNVRGVDFSRGTLDVQNQGTSEREEVGFSVVFGTDGSASAMRHEMLRRKGFEGSEEFENYGYKELHIPPGPNGTSQLEKNVLHIWPRGSYMLIALPNHDGSFTATLFLPYHGPASFDVLKTPGDVKDFFKMQFSDVVPFMPELEENFFSNPTGHLVTVKCHPWNCDGKGLLLGDAAHAMVPFFGQGMNCGFEDCTVLNQCLERFDGGWEKVFSEFISLRKVHADAIAAMAVENFIEMRDKVANPRFLLEKKVEGILQQKFPGDYISRYRLVTFSNVPYEVAYRAGLIQNEILGELCGPIADAHQVDLNAAEKLIHRKLTPYLVQARKESPWI